MRNTKIKGMLVLFLFLEMQASYCMPQGFFSQKFSISNVASWNSNDKSLTLLPNVKVESPIKNSFINIFGKKNTIDNYVSKTERTPTNIGNIGQANEGLMADQNILNSIGRAPVTTNYKNKDIGQGSINNNHIDDITTESLIETTTDEYETTTFDEDIFNRASPQLVASLLG